MGHFLVHTLHHSEEKVYFLDHPPQDGRTFLRGDEMDFQHRTKLQCLMIHSVALAFEISDDEAGVFWCESGLAAEYAEVVK